MYSQSSTGLRWRKSSHSSPEQHDCVEVAAAGAEVAIRDSKDPAGPALSISRRAFSSFVAHVKGDRQA